MAKKVKFELNREGVRELLQSAEMAAIVSDAAERVAAAASSGGRDYATEIRVGGTRVTARVKPADAAAYYSNMKHNTLLKSLGSGKV